jgi:hypothetical protein
MGCEINRWGLKSSVEESFMSRNKDVSNISRRRFLAVAGSVAATSSLAVGKDSSLTQPVPAPPPPVHYLVTIHVKNDKICYTAKNMDTHLDVPMPNNDLTVYKGDEVKWEADTPGPNARHRGHVYFKTSPFAGHDFRWSENRSDGGKTLTAGTYYYCVAIFDKVKQEAYADDPKIIVGGAANATEEVEKAETELSEVREKIESIESMLKEAIEKLKQQCG